MAVAELWETLKQSIVAYTGLSPAAFFTAVAVAAALYHVVSGLFAAPPPPPPRPREEPEAEPLPPPVQMGEVSEEELSQYDGSDPKKPLLMAIKGQIYDVTQSRMFYGPGGPYALFAGKDASRALAKMSFEPQDLTGDITGLGPFELDALQDWEYKFMSKYVKVGTVTKNVTVEDRSSAASTAPGTSEAATEAEKAPTTTTTEEKPREVPAEAVKEKEAAAAAAAAGEGAQEN
ncbi:Membrane steroid-binding protein 2 [Zea mays]|uniref:Membrane steroid-binding protein 1 n=3 Tax=Zea mays TaxID=4577 RepID=B6TD62_MAIZE|nr:membrane steroid-binding protein 1 [Zea mays]ACG35045.1 membrane steroid-binding protein 1 [Zea mays]AQK64805.1 Membrane steroid-binding protein 1 [Zea mays]PWZ24137.1 Membrane steroid-binding protein 2 [Zea mays]|eukprot:NP_001149328.1 membrane steroid-binding protein 1 [Zea mays]